MERIVRWLMSFQMTLLHGFTIGVCSHLKLVGGLAVAVGSAKRYLLPIFGSKAGGHYAS